MPVEREQDRSRNPSFGCLVHQFWTASNLRPPNALAQRESAGVRTKKIPVALRARVTVGAANIRIVTDIIMRIQMLTSLQQLACRSREFAGFVDCWGVEASRGAFWQVLTLGSRLGLPKWQ